MKNKNTLIHIAFSNAFDLMEMSLEKMLDHSEQKLEKLLGKKNNAQEPKRKQIQARKKKLQDLARFQEHLIKIQKESIVEKRLSELELHKISPAQKLDRA